MKPVALDGDLLPPYSTQRASVQLGQGINDVERGQIVFWAQTGRPTTILDRKSCGPTPSKWSGSTSVPPSTPTPGTTQANLDLLKNVGITALGWEGSMADALSFANVTFDPTAVQDAVVNEVQAIYHGEP